jgi:D-serine deaminase-like pyridoxal phosphate-dependent protein
VNGLNLDTLKTPSLILDGDKVKRNAGRIGAIAKRLGVRLRPHIKTHKCIEIARMQTAGFDGAVTVSTLEEARVFARGGFTDFTYAVPIEPGKFADAIELVRSGVKLNVLTDDISIPAKLDTAAAEAGTRMSVFVEIDCGDHRSGVDPSTDAAIEIARAIRDSNSLDFAGLLTHAGHSYGATSVEEIVRIARAERDTMVEIATRFRAAGIEVPTVSIGSTPTISHIDHLEGIDEVRPGNYIFFDAYQATLGSCDFEDCALSVLAAVVHRSYEQKKIIVDAGAIALSKDRGPIHLDATCGFGRVLDLDGNDTGLRMVGMSQEHGTIPVADQMLLDRLPVGTRLRILANHSCLTAAQYDRYHVVDGIRVVDEWQIHRGW